MSAANPPASICLQDQFAPHGICFGCSPDNPLGLGMRSYVDGDVIRASFAPQNHHQGFEGMLNGGIIGAVLDCHMNWTAAWNLMLAAGSDEPPCTVTGSYQVNFIAPTPVGVPLEAIASLVEENGRKAKITARLEANGNVTAEGSGVFVAVKEGHPAFNRWN
ncbi:MAG: PaaI family thioesterase [Planctomycetota bacterium]|nr:PaaI family thioesterase [Planctomycetota bacterium]